MALTSWRWLAAGITRETTSQNSLDSRRTQCLTYFQLRSTVQKQGKFQHWYVCPGMHALFETHSWTNYWTLQFACVHYGTQAQLGVLSRIARMQFSLMSIPALENICYYLHTLANKLHQSFLSRQAICVVPIPFILSTCLRDSHILFTLLLPSLQLPGVAQTCQQSFSCTLFSPVYI